MFPPTEIFNGIKNSSVKILSLVKIEPAVVTTAAK